MYCIGIVLVLQYILLKITLASSSTNSWYYKVFLILGI